MSDREFRYEDVLQFWFSDATKPNWFARSDAFDQDITTRFKDMHAAADAGALDSWMGTPESALALILVLDQFPRNMYRGTSRAFASDAKALTCAKEVLARGYLPRLTYQQRQFVYLPFMHSEDLTDQNRCVHLCQVHGDEGVTKFAIEHRDIVAQFGRFPHRNAFLSRVSTPEEVEFLKTHSGF